MSPFTKMQVRMLLPCLTPLPVGIGLAIGASFAIHLPERLGGKAVSSGVPDLIMAVALLLTVLLLAIQSIRLFAWMKGGGLSCDGCGSLLGRVRDGRYGPYRRCLGCERNQALNG